MDMMEVGMAMDSSSITNYDVLVEPPSIPGGEGGDYQLAKHKNHVGNNRLDVFLNLHQSTYDDAFSRGDFDKCNEIVQKIVGTVCHHCVPPGRFLVCSKDPTSTDRMLWTQMTEDTAKSLLHKVLAPTLPTKSKSKRSDDGVKRRRRSSLLRRSASESMVTAFQDDKKKVTRFDQMGSNSNVNWGSNQNSGGLGSGFALGSTGLGSRTSIASGASATSNKSLNRMDVILTDERNALDPNSQSVGNNRLHILVAMQSGQYQTSTPEARNGMISEAYKTVKIFWKGRFLVEATDGSHDELDEDEAKYALRCIFDERTGMNTQAPLQRHSSPAFSGGSSTAPPAAVAPPTQFFTSRPFGLHKQSSLTMMPETSPGPEFQNVEDMRKSAVKSLQKQKQRQTIANRLEKISQRNLSGAAMPPPAPQNRGTSLFGGGARLPFRMPGASRSYPSIQAKRESTVLGKLDASVMDQLVADFEEADCDDDDPEPLPPSNSNQFGSQWNGFR